LTYVTLDEANGGIIRNLSGEGVAVQAVAALRPEQNVRVRFELRYPQLRVETRGEVMWANPGGQCGIRFLDLDPAIMQQIHAWIFESLLESAPRFPWAGESVAATLSQLSENTEESDGLIVSPVRRNVIQLEPRSAAATPVPPSSGDLHSFDVAPETDWLSQPLSGKTLAWMVDSLMILAALLLFSLVFLAITHGLPKWPLAMVGGAAIFVAAFYWAFFRIFGGASLGRRLASMAAPDSEEEEPSTPFR
jgi:hypothetical protein